MLLKAQKSALQSEATLVRFFNLRRGDLKKALASEEEARSDAEEKTQKSTLFILKKTTIRIFLKKLGFF